MRIAESPFETASDDEQATGPLLHRSAPKAGVHNPKSPQTCAHENDAIIVIEKHSLVRECLTRCLNATRGGGIFSFASVEVWLQARGQTPSALVVLSMAGSAKNREIEQLEMLLSQTENPAPVVVMSDNEDPDHIIAVLEKGARGFLPTDMSLEIAIEALHLVLAGGVFVPVSTLLAARSMPNGPLSTKAAEHAEIFTARQIAVIEALRKGKANKIIAYELNMCESTVKVHVRNIMKKLSAKNRTQVAFLANEMLNEKNRRSI
jgi:DNA-binding NarL/FixJ family response regulator